MAKIIAGVATSHIPAVGAALDLGKTNEPYWNPVFAGYDRAKEWFKEVKPDAIILIYKIIAYKYNDECN